MQHQEAQRLQGSRHTHTDPSEGCLAPLSSSRPQTLCPDSPVSELRLLLNGGRPRRAAWWKGTSGPGSHPGCRLPHRHSDSRGCCPEAPVATAVVSSHPSHCQSPGAPLPSTLTSKSRQAARWVGRPLGAQRPLSAHRAHTAPLALTNLNKCLEILSVCPPEVRGGTCCSPACPSTKWWMEGHWRKGEAQRSGNPGRGWGEALYQQLRAWAGPCSPAGTGCCPWKWLPSGPCGGRALSGLWGSLVPPRGAPQPAAGKRARRPCPWGRRR